MLNDFFAFEAMFSNSQEIWASRLKECRKYLSIVTHYVVYFDVLFQVFVSIEFFIS